MSRFKKKGYRKALFLWAGIILLVSLFLVGSAHFSGIFGKVNFMPVAGEGDCPSQKCFFAETDSFQLPKNILDMSGSDFKEFLDRQDVKQATRNAKEMLNAQVDSFLCPQGCKRDVSSLEETMIVEPDQPAPGKCKGKTFNIDITAIGRKGVFDVGLANTFGFNPTNCELALKNAVENANSQLKSLRNKNCGNNCDLQLSFQRLIIPDCIADKGKPDVDNSEVVTIKIIGTAKCVGKSINKKYYLKFKYKRCVTCSQAQAN